MAYFPYQSSHPHINTFKVNIICSCVWNRNQKSLKQKFFYSEDIDSTYTWNFNSVGEAEKQSLLVSAF